MPVSEQVLQRPIRVHPAGWEGLGVTLDHLQMWLLPVWWRNPRFLTWLHHLWVGSVMSQQALTSAWKKLCSLQSGSVLKSRIHPDKQLNSNNQRILGFHLFYCINFNHEQLLTSCLVLSN